MDGKRSESEEERLEKIGISEQVGHDGDGATRATACKSA